MAVRFGTPSVVIQAELESVQKRAAKFVTGNYSYETGSMTVNSWTVNLKVGIPQEKEERGKTIDLYCYIKVLKVKPVYHS